MMGEEEMEVGGCDEIVVDGEDEEGKISLRLRRSDILMRAL